MPKVYHRFDTPKVQGYVQESKDMTDQSFKDEADINNIMKRYWRTGVLGDPNTLLGMPRFEDVSEAPEDFMTAQNKLIDADAAFMRLPSRLRRRFGDSPLELMKFLEVEENRAEAIQLGLIVPRVAQETTSVVSGDIGRQGSNVPEKAPEGP